MHLVDTVNELFDEILPELNLAFKNTEECRRFSETYNTLSQASYKGIGALAGDMAYRRFKAVQYHRCAALHAVSGPATSRIMLTPADGLWLTELSERDALYRTHRLLSQMHNQEPTLFGDLEMNATHVNVRDAIRAGRKKHAQDLLMNQPVSFAAMPDATRRYALQAKHLGAFKDDINGREWRPVFVSLEKRDILDLGWAFGENSFGPNRQTLGKGHMLQDADFCPSISHQLEIITLWGQLPDSTRAATFSDELERRKMTRTKFLEEGLNARRHAGALTDSPKDAVSYLLHSPQIPRM